METIDRGHDPDTHEQLWGSLPGPFLFERKKTGLMNFFRYGGGLMQG